MASFHIVTKNRKRLVAGSGEETCYQKDHGEEIETATDDYFESTKRPLFTQCSRKTESRRHDENDNDYSVQHILKHVVPFLSGFARSSIDCET
ncbi:MAG: hypothetical protein J6575_01255 [Bifidobacterium sp.]|nr:hypothetical protein [Bifidobacterium sp.]